MTLYQHVPHPHIAGRRETGPVTVAGQAAAHSAYARFNSWLGLKITTGVGSMTCAYAFTALALISLPAAIGSGDLIVIVSWVAQTLIQLVLLSIILFGQGLQAQAADARSVATYNDAEAILATATQIQDHLAAQDTHLLGQDDKLGALIAWVETVVAHLTAPAVTSTGSAEPS